MAKQTLMWTTLPNGGNAAAGGTLRLSVLLSPRLEAPVAKSKLSAFPEMANWPSKAKALKFTVNFQSASGTVSVPTTISSELQDDLWAQIFPPTTLVRSHVFEKMDDRFIVSYPYSHMAKSLKGIYQFVAASSPAGFPPSEGLRNLLAPLERLRGNDFGTTSNNGNAWKKARLDALKKANSSTRCVPPTNAPNLAIDVQLFDLFHSPQVTQIADSQTGKPITKLTPLPDAASFQDEIDFHQMVSSLGKHPELLKRLGLLFDLEVKLPSSVAPGGLLWVDVSPSAKSGDLDVKPRTRYSTKNGFQAQSKSKNLQNGLLALNGDEFDIVQFDVDGAMMKTLNLHSSLGNAQTQKTIDTPQFHSVPALRSGGLCVARAGRALELAQNFGDSSGHNAKLQTLTSALAAPNADKKAVENAHVVELWAEDLVRGFRIDVREIPVDVLGNALPGGKPGEWRSLMRRVGEYRTSSTRIAPDFKPDEGAIQIAVTSPANAAPASKPDLYLHEAMFRWAGWSLAAPRPDKALGPNDAPQETGNLAPPGMNLEISFKPEAATLPRLRFGKRYQMRARMCDLAGNGPSYKLEGNAGASDVTEGFYARFEPLASPTLLLTQQLSDAQTPGESLERIVIRTRNTRPDKDDDVSSDKTVRHIAPPKTSQETAELHGMFDKDGLNPADYATFAEKDGDFDGTERSGRVAPDSQLDLPYLPDPLAVNALFLGLPGSTAATSFLQNQAFDGAWPNKKPFRLRTSESKSGWDSGNRVLDVALPKAEIYTVAMYSQMPTAQIANMGVWRWAAEALLATPAKLDVLNKVAAAGVFWMLTPPRFLTFVHATQQPIGVPQWKQLQPRRNIGETFTRFEGTLQCHGKSTGRVDVLAAWSEPIDNPSDPSNKPDADKQNGQARAWEMPFHIGNFRIVPETELPLSDSKGVYGIYREKDTTLTFTARVNRFQNARRHEFGDTKHRLVRYRAKSTTRFREYFPEEIRQNEDNLTRSSPEIALHVPSSARPDAPKVLYVIPTFRWNKSDKSSTRIAGLRVYLDRPWFSSGDDELLGVVVLNPPLGIFEGDSPNVDLLETKPLIFGTLGSTTPTATSHASPMTMVPNVFASTIRPMDMPLPEGVDNIIAIDDSRRNLVPLDEKVVNKRALALMPNAAISIQAFDRMRDESIVEKPVFDAQIAVSKNNVPIFAAIGELISTTLPPPPPAVPDKLKPYVTQWGMDPIWSSAPTRGLPSPKSFPLATASGTNLSLDENGEAVAVAGHTPQFDQDRNLWYCDIEMNLGMSYFPFVRLALARFQPYSVDGAHLSRVVLADFAQLPAQRSASFSRSGNNVRVTVSGAHHRGNGDTKNAMVLSQPLNIGRIEAVVERKNSDSDLGWRAVSSTELAPDALISKNPIKTWTADIELPNADGDLRLVIKEWENYRADKDDASSSDPNWSDKWQLHERLVYADVIPL